MACFAGEKERGTFAAILLSPVWRIEIVLGNALGIIIRTMAIAGGILLVLLSLIFAAFGYFSIVQVVSLLLLTLSLTVVMAALVLMISIMNRTISWPRRPASFRSSSDAHHLYNLHAETGCTFDPLLSSSVLRALLRHRGRDGRHIFDRIARFASCDLPRDHRSAFFAAERLLHVERFTLLRRFGKRSGTRTAAAAVGTPHTREVRRFAAKPRLRLRAENGCVPIRG